ncbi:hypothetical protein [Kineosporia sp. NBRC 101731]|uniref:hypothetical protein n=1 Tax=Kineosporia sp. NBRC 101731 TaxID=3032199 RepID=UPI0024A13305|nr:hypothetical protein [Kineosporia sp. NBRC 101731]GLY32199.1 hypothetical protein Kisp02_55640 [Kineosporia sp. NBRC 101731]
MRSRLITAPWWVLALIVGTPVSAFLALFLHLTDPYLDFPGVLFALPAGAIVGLAVGRLTAETNAQTMEVAALDNQDELAQALRASRRGPVPTDPRIRQAAHRLAVLHLSRFKRQQTSAAWTFVPLCMLYTGLAINSSPWWLLALAFFALMLALNRVLPTRTARRIIELAPTNDEHDTGQAVR